MGPAYLTQPQIHRIPVLLEEIRQGRLRVPRFQRAFVWTAQQRIELLESINEAQPIGSLLFWRTRQALPSYDWIGPVPFEPTESGPAGETREYVLDGHQRLTTLYSALAEGLVPPEGSEVPPPGGELPPGGPIYFDLETQQFNLWQRKGEPPPTWLPMAILLDDFRMDAFRQQLPDGPDRRRWFNRAQHLATRFKDYAIPVVPLVTEDLDVAVRAFTRVNRSGTRVSEVDLMNALTWSEDYDLNERIEEAQWRIRQEGWSGLDPDLILKTCRAALGMDIYQGDAEDLRAKLMERPGLVGDVGESLAAAAAFLRDECGVWGPELLPYSFQIVLIAEVFGLSKAAGSLADLSQLKSWFWATTFGEYFAGMNSSRLARTRDHLSAAFERAASANPEDLDRPIQPAGRFDFRSARTRALVVLQLRELRPRTLAGEPIEPHRVASLGNSAVFQLVGRRDVGWWLGFGGDQLLYSAANRFIAPPEHARDLRAALLNTPDRIPPEVLESHAITPATLEALKARQWSEFLGLRRATLIDLERQAVEALGLEFDASAPP